MTTALHESMNRAVAYLLCIQDEDGGWRDYQLPVGASDQWVTAFTGLGLTAAADCLDSASALSGAARAAEFLLSRQAYDCGWGYNREVGVDADSTAHALLLFRALGIRVRDKDEACLLAHRREDGGFSTYVEGTAWGLSHPEVSTAAGLALGDRSLAMVRSGLLEYCRSCRLEDGSWPTYWWRNHGYGTCYMLMLYERLGICIEPTRSMPVRIDSCFDFAWSLGCLAYMDCSPGEIIVPVESLHLLQEPCGRWPGSASLRATDPHCPAPWVSPQGVYYTDGNATITTASVLRVLSLLQRKKSLLTEAA